MEKKISNPATQTQEPDWRKLYWDGVRDYIALSQRNIELTAQLVDYQRTEASRVLGKSSDPTVQPCKVC